MMDSNTYKLELWILILILNIHTENYILRIYAEKIKIFK